jgi:hypothetical protein
MGQGLFTSTVTRMPSDRLPVAMKVLIDRKTVTDSDVRKTSEVSSTEVDAIEDTYH